jgi:hypothetical protein
VDRYSAETGGAEGSSSDGEHLCAGKAAG